ncbi:MAG: DUF1800 family protein [Pseudomonadota bacterium]
MSMRAAIAATRFGLGARPGEIAAASGDPEAWLGAQLTKDSAARFPADGLSSAKDGVAFILDFRRQIGPDREPDQDQMAALRRRIRQTIIGEVQARALFGATTPNPFHERLARFWSNHFTVSARNPPTTLIAGAYEREAIRPNILGRFEDLLLAAIGHPGMLVYLDNWQSVGPNSRAGRRRRRGLNENLAREVLELHTATPAAGYTQYDVTEFAKALTGWTVGNRHVGRNRIGEPIFSTLLHEPGARTVLGKRYAEDGRAQAEAILRDLANRPETARNIALKLARHIVSDTPDDALVANLERVFLDTGGDLSALYRALIASPEAWAAEAEKVKTPDELLTSASRQFGVRRVFAGKPGEVYESFAQRPFSAPSPEGWPDDADAWLGPDALMKRVEWANRVAERTSGVDARDFIDDALGPRAGASTLQAVSRAESGEQALAIALMSPDFQRR